jgi:hypothetical protein
MADAHSGKLLATPSQAQQCCGLPSGPNIVFRNTYQTISNKEILMKLIFVNTEQ